MAVLDQTTAPPADAATQIGQLTLVALTILGLTGLAMVALLSMPVTLPVGAMNWDVNIYLDAANRILSGQIPSVDFFAPVGPLGYYLGAAGFSLFPNGQPVLVTSWSLAAITLPLMAAICWDAGRRGDGGWAALLVAIPFALFAFLPFNTTPGSTFPAADGFGIYNRQASQLLYCLVAALLFVRTQWLLAILVGLAMTALFYLKVTGFVAGGLICLLALLTGRIGWRAALGSAGVFVVLSGLMELALGGIVSAYIRDIITLVTMNTEALAPRMLQAVSRTFATTAATVALGLVLAVAGFQQIAGLIRTRKLPALLDHPAAWLAVVLIAGLFFESQNTGSQELILLWPVIIMIALQLGLNAPRSAATALTIGLAAAVVLPMTAATVQSAARATVGGLKQEPLAHDHLGVMGQMTTRPRMLARADLMQQVYQDHPGFETDLIAARETPTPQLYADFDFQILMLKTADEAVAALKAHEANGLVYETVLAMNFTNPYAWLLGKQAPRHVAIGADPTRAVPQLDDVTREAVAGTDLVLIPTCPDAIHTKLLMDIYAPALTQHRRVTLTGCHDLLVHPDIDYDFTG